MSYTRSYVPIKFKYSINDIRSSGYCVEDFGFTFDQSLTFYTHIGKDTCKALKLLRFVIRILAEFKLSSSLKTLHCLSGMIIWDPYTLDCSCQLKRVQYTFLKLATFILCVIEENRVI